MIEGDNVLGDLTASPTQSKQNKFTCICCRSKFESGDLQKSHFKTEWHLYNLKRRVCDLTPIDLENFEKIQADAAERKKNEEASNHSKSSLRSRTNDVPSPSSSSKGDDEVSEIDVLDDWEDVDESELLDEDYDEEEEAEMLARVVKTDTCLFCNKKSPTMEDNVNHMDRMHGFFIPEEKYVIDLDGLLDYLGFKVGAGAVCIWCNKQFKNVQGVRLHMLYKDHCKILYEHSNAIEEFKEFYDYSTQEIHEMKPLNELAIPKKRSETRKEYDRSLVKAKHSASESKKLVVSGSRNLAAIPGSYQSKNIKKFNAYRAKILLRTGMANNYSMRGRLRQQNPL